VWRSTAAGPPLPPTGLVRQGSRGIIPRRPAGRLTAVRSGSAVGSGPAAFGFVLQLLDELVQAEDDLLLQLLGLRTALGDVEPLADDVHLASHGAQVLVLPGLHVEEHESRHRAVTLGSARAVFEQTEDGAGGFFALQG